MNKWGAGEAKNEILFGFQKYRIFSFGGRINGAAINGFGYQKYDSFRHARLARAGGRVEH